MIGLRGCSQHKVFCFKGLSTHFYSTESLSKIKLPSPRFSWSSLSKSTKHRYSLLAYTSGSTQLHISSGQAGLTLPWPQRPQDSCFGPHKPYRYLPAESLSLWHPPHTLSPGWNPAVSQVVRQTQASDQTKSTVLAIYKIGNLNGRLYPTQSNTKPPGSSTQFRICKTWRMLRSQCCPH